MATVKAVVLCSGGLNSAVAASIARQSNAGLRLAFLHVRFEHRAERREADLFEKQAAFFGAHQKLLVEMPHFAAIGGNARVSPKLQLQDALAIGAGGSNSYIPGLIQTLLGVGFTWASVICASKIYLGVSENLGPPAPRTADMFPDYAREHIELCRHGFSVVAVDRPISIETPLIDLSRTEIVRLGNRLKTPFGLTWSCVSSGRTPCGACVGCATRNRGFLDAALPDPVLCASAAEVTAS